MDNLFSTHPDTREPHRRAAGDGGRRASSRRRSRHATARRPEAPKANPWGRNPTGPRSRLQRPVVLSDETVTRHGRSQAERAVRATRGTRRQRRRHSRPCGAPGGGKAARRGHRRPHAARRPDRPRPRPSATSARSRCATGRWCAPSWRPRCATAARSRALIARRLERPLPANAHQLSHMLHVAAAQILFLDIPDSAAVDLAVTARQVRSAHRALRRPGQRRAARHRPRQGRRAAGRARQARRRAGMVPRAAGRRLWRRRARRRSSPRIGVEAPVDFTVKSDPERWARALGGIVLPTGSVRVERLAAGGGRAARLRRRRMVGAGCRREPAGAAARRCRGPARRRPLRRARRQDGAARAGRRRGDRASTRRETG